MELLYLTHPAFSRHDTGTWHPERPARLVAVEEGVMASGLDIRRIEAERVDPDVLAGVHTPAYVAAIERFCRAGGGALDPDTVACAETYDAALRAAGAGPQAVALLRRHHDASAFLAVRPPGHHALADRAMGFCVFNNVVVTARMLASAGERVAILDWDVHHGNGTQELVWDDPDVLYISMHQYPFYPMTGTADERGGPQAPGTVINIPLPAGTAGDAYRAVMDRIAMPAMRDFAPDWVLVSAGYDAHAADPLAELRLEATDYASMASALTRIVPANRIVTFLEGGYDLAAIAASVTATVRGVAGIASAGPGPMRSPTEAFDAVDRVASML